MSGNELSTYPHEKKSMHCITDCNLIIKHLSASLFIPDAALVGLGVVVRRSLRLKDPIPSPFFSAR